MSTIHKLTEYFSQFPGIGPRQSKRFVHFLLTRNKSFLDELVQLLVQLKQETSICSSCCRFFANNASQILLCEICSNQNRNNNSLMIVEKDVDFENIERSGAYDGKYFILGGTVPILDKNPEQKIRSKELLKHIEKQINENKIEEIIFAFSVNSDGENTAQYVTELLSQVVKKHNITFSTLGRGLSTGTELEYSDSETIKNAFKNRA